MKKTFLAAALYKHNQPLKIIKDLKIPKPSPNQILAKILYSGLCGSQIAEIKGHRDDKKYLPHLLGHEGYAEVISVGKNVTKIKLGDKIILSWIKGRGKESGGHKYNYSNTIINSGPISTFSDYSLISENRCFKAPQGINPKLAVLFGCALPTGLGMIINELKPRLNKSIILFGLGGVGFSALIALLAFKPRNLVVVDKKDKNFFLKKINRNITFLKYQKYINYYIRSNNGNYYDYAIDCSGESSVTSLAFKILKPQGKMIFASHPKKSKKIIIDPYELICGKKICGSWGGGSKLDTDIEKFYQLHKKKIIKLNLLKTKIYKLSNINRAVKDMQKGKIIRAILKHF